MIRIRTFPLLLSAALMLAGCGNSNGQSRSKSTSTMDTTSQYDHSNNPYYSHTETAKLDVAKSEWKKLLPDELYYIAFEKGTERPFTGKFWDFEGIGTYACAVCGNVLFQADAKFSSSCGWPTRPFRIVPRGPLLEMVAVAWLLPLPTTSGSVSDQLLTSKMGAATFSDTTPGSTDGTRKPSPS